MKFDPEQDLAGEGAESRLKSCSGQELLERLPKVQRLLSRMLACVPDGAAGYHPIVLVRPRSSGLHDYLPARYCLARPLPGASV
jgi:hypothetical protein